MRWCGRIRPTVSTSASIRSSIQRAFDYLQRGHDRSPMLFSACPFTLLLCCKQLCPDAARIVHLGPGTFPVQRWACLQGM